MTAEHAEATTTHTDLDDLRQIWRMRAFEEKVVELRLADDVVGSVHLGSGQETLPAVLASVMAPDDAVFATYRGHTWALGCGVPPQRLFAELMGRTSGINGGRGGSAHFSAPAYRFFGENSIVGAGAPIAAGSALAGRFDGSGRVALTVFGDGAMNQGSVHEALNFTSAMKLPVVFLCENNSWSEMTAIDEMVADPQLFHRASAYAMKGERFDGNDPVVARQHLAGAFDYARSGQGPVLLEAMTARLAGHYIGDVQQYRRPGELNQAKENDPIRRLRERLSHAGYGTEDLDAIESQARAEMDAAVESARADALADPTTAKEYLYV